MHWKQKVDGANQTLKMADANYRAARANIGYYRASGAPTIGVAPSISAVRYSANQPYLSSSAVNNGNGNFVLPLELDYEIDLWGRIHRQVTAVGSERTGKRRRSCQHAAEPARGGGPGLYGVTE